MPETAEDILAAEDPAQAQAAAPPVINKRIAQYIELRDKIDKENDAHKARMKPLTDTLIKLNNVILQHFLEHGGDSLTVRGVGTAYVTAKKSATIADGEAFKRFVIGAQAYELLDWRANAPAVTAWMEANQGEVPPGLNFRAVNVVGVRRAS